MMIKEKRKEKELTQKELADLVGIEVRNIRRIESGEAKMSNLRFENAIGLSEALDIDLHELAKYAKEECKRSEKPKQMRDERA